jgi:peptidyl-prolyl cis-trans isomerase C
MNCSYFFRVNHRRLLPVWAATAALLSCASTPLWSQAAPASPSATPVQPGTAIPKPRGPMAVAQTEPDRVVAVINGEKITAKRAMELLRMITPEERKQFPETPEGVTRALQQIFIKVQFAAEAEKSKLADAPPWKDDLANVRRSILAQAYLQQLTTGNYEVKDADITKYYADHASEYEQMKLAVIYVSFLPPGSKPPADGKPGRTQEEAKAKADDLVKKLRAGADFTDMAKKESDDAASAKNGGEIGSFPAGKNNLPAPINAAVAKLTKGQLTDPLEQRTGYYIIEMSDRVKVPFDEAKPRIIEQLRSLHANEVMKSTLDKYKVQVDDNDFFDTGAKPPQPGSKTPPQQPGQTSAH